MLFDLSNNLIIGQGLTSIETAQYLLRIGKPFKIYSLRENTLPESLSKYYTNQLSDYSMVWLSPGIPSNAPCMQGLDLDKVWIDIDYFLYMYDKPVILVTGTNGKSTVSRMIQLMLSQLGFKAQCYGNYQPGLLNVLSNHMDWVVLELSSYQLERMRFSGKVAASILLNISSDHIRWHGSYGAYQLAKLKILSLSDMTIGVGGQYSFLERAFNLAKYNYSVQEALNLGAAQEVLFRLGLKPVELDILPQLPYRQCVVCKDNQIIVNDSKSTNIASTVSAIHVFRERYPSKPILLIMAGIEKEDQYNELINILCHRVKIIIIGEGFKGLSPYISMRYHCIEDAMSCIINHKGVVLFSPGGASYDQYGSYEERGKDFNRCLFNTRESG